ncbi:hypothetical protein QQF64_011843 [Cirrhinus molitorella]|uniref:Uncharacterized protein n=1 Tax=Cirrhinus molitorella TaxID=172907 RepID=A0ABR3LTR6_9TELE
MLFAEGLCGAFFPSGSFQVSWTAPFSYTHTLPDVNLLSASQPLHRNTSKPSPGFCGLRIYAHRPDPPCHGSLAPSVAGHKPLSIIKSLSGPVRSHYGIALGVVAKDITQYTVTLNMEPGKMWFVQYEQNTKLSAVMVMTELGMNKQGLSATLLEASQDKSDAAGMSHQASGSAAPSAFSSCLYFCHLSLTSNTGPRRPNQCRADNYNYARRDEVKQYGMREDYMR